MSHPYYFSPKRLQTKTEEEQEQEARNHIIQANALRRRMEGKRILFV